MSVPVSHSTSSTTVISPFVTTYSPDAFINIDSTLAETVTVAGIQNVFDISLNEAETVVFLNGFDCSGARADCRLSQHDYDFSGLQVTMVPDGAFESLLASKIVAAQDSNNKIIDKYLANQLQAAFAAAFGDIIAASAITGNVNSDADNGNNPTAGGTANGAVDPAVDNGNVVGSVSTELNTTINSYSVDVLTDGAVAAANLVDGHNGAQGALRSIFRQCGRGRMDKYLRAGADGAAEPLTTKALPLTTDDIIEFVFDIDVTTADANAGATLDEEGVTVAGTQSTTYGIQNFALNLANRRVAVRFQMFRPEGVAPGTAITDLKTGELAVPTGNPASGAGSNVATDTTPA